MNTSKVSQLLICKHYSAMILASTSHHRWENIEKTQKRCTFGKETKYETARGEEDHVGVTVSPLTRLYTQSMNIGS
jgi:hypothetical protein